MSMTTWGSFVGSLLGGYGKCVVGLTFYLDIIHDSHVQYIEC